MTDIFRNWTQYTCSSVIQNGVEYTLGGWNCDEEIYKASMEANIFAPLSYTVEDAYAPWAGLYPYQYWYERDWIISDTMYTSIRIAYVQVTSSSRRYDCIYANKEFRKDCTAGSFVIYSWSFNSGKMLWCATFVKEWTALTSLCDKKIENSTYRRVASVYDFTLDGTVTETVLWTWDYDDKSVYQTDEQFEAAMLVLYQNHLESLSAIWWEQKQAALISRQDLSNGTTSNHYNVILQWVNPYVYPPTIEWDNYIDLTTNWTCNLPINAAVYYSIDDEEVGKYADTSISIPAGSHTVRIIPYNTTPGWAIWFQLKTWVTSITHDAPYSAYSASDTNTWTNYKKDFAKNCTTLTSVPVDICTIPNTVTTIGDGFMYSMFEWCTWLTTAPTISISENVTSIGNGFMYSMFEWCTWLTATPTISIPEDVTSIGNDYMRRQFYGCTWLTTTATESMGDDVLTIGDYFMSERYEWCTWLTTTTAEVMGDSVTTIGNYFANRKFYWCTWLTINQEEDLWTSLTTIWANFRDWEYQTCTWLLSTRNEVMPNTVTTILNNFRYQQFRWCTNITTVWEEALSSWITSIWSAFRSTQFYGCTAITSITWWRDSAVGGSNYRYQQFYSCNTNKTVKVLTDVWYSAQSNTLTNTYVTEVQVPNAYLSNFTSTTSVYPRRSITDNKFVWY